MNTETATISRRALAGLGGEAILRLVLRLDALVTGANGAVYLAAASVIDSSLGLSSTLLRPTGGFLLVFGAGVWYLSTGATISKPAVRALVAANAGWAAASLLVVATGTFSPTTAGSVWIAFQAAAVALFATVQVLALRRAAR